MPHPTIRPHTFEKTRASIKNTQFVPNMASMQPRPKYILAWNSKWQLFQISSDENEIMLIFSNGFVGSLVENGYITPAFKKERILNPIRQMAQNKPL